MQNQKNDTSTQEPKLVNRVAQSGLITYVLEDLAPATEVKEFDIANYLWQGLVLREKEFRAALKEINWADYQDCIVCVHCSADAIVPTWAYMLVTSYAVQYHADVYMGTRHQFLEIWYAKAIDGLDTSDLVDARVVVKGCSKEDVPESAYVALVKKLQPLVRSLMYGEPCSTVPVYKRPKV